MPMKKSELAKAVATYAHSGQTDKAGKPYILHPLAVAEKMSTEEQKVVALLHDVLEDTFVNEDTIRNLFGDIIADAVIAITKRPGETYEDFVRRVATNPISKAVKLADLEHNMDLSRLDSVSEKDLERVRKYERAKEFLMLN